MNPWLLIFRLKALHLCDAVCIVKRVILTLNPMVEKIESYWVILSFGTVYDIVQVYSIKQLCDFVLFLKRFIVPRRF